MPSRLRGSLQEEVYHLEGDVMVEVEEVPVRLVFMLMKQ